MKSEMESGTRDESAIARRNIDPGELWLDESITPEELIRLDPLDITPEMVEQAEQPELGDYSLQSLPERASTVRLEAAYLKCRRAELQAAQSRPG